MELLAVPYQYICFKFIGPIYIFFLLLQLYSYTLATFKQIRRKPKVEFEANGPIYITKVIRGNGD